MEFDYLIVGAGAAGVFSAIMAKESRPDLRVAIIEKSAVALAKVKVSGGGRCNVTHNCFDPMQLAQNYPRGGKELVGAFHRFQPKDMIAWLEERGVQTKVEADGRIFPVTDSSQTIIECLLGQCRRLGIEIFYRKRITEIQKEGERFALYFEVGEPFFCRALLLATGSSAQGHEWARAFGHTIEPPVPSLFTFNVPGFSLVELSGVAVNPAEMTIEGCPFKQKGPLLITHFGFSGPCAIKLSAWAARWLGEKEYRARLIVNWLPDQKEEALFERLIAYKKAHPLKKMATETPLALPKSLWRHFAGDERTFGEASHKELRELVQRLQRDVYQMEGKTTHKEEFVTCGGVRLKEVDFKSMESKICPGLYFAGEILDIDGVTGGFNFQNGWTTGCIAGRHAAEKSVNEDH